MMRRTMDPQYDAGSGSDDNGSAHSGRKSVGFSGPLSSTTTPTKRLARKKTTPFQDQNHDHDQEYVEITLDVRDDGVSIQEIKGAEPDHNQEAALLTEHLQQERQANSGCSGSTTSATVAGARGPPRRLTSQLSAKMMKYVSKELRRVTSISSRKEKQYDRAKSSAALALRGLQFINKSRVGDEGWTEVQNRFEQLAVDGLLPKSRFGQCIGMSEKEFASELFDALARRRGIVTAMISKAQLKDFWEQLSDQSFDARIQTFFDMVDKNADGRISEEEVREIISLSASTNKLGKLQEHAEEYAALIMEELDPDGIGYIEIYNLETLLLQGTGQPANSSSDTRKLSQLLSQKLVPTKEPNPIKRWFRRLAYFLQDNWRRVWVILLWLSICILLFAWKFIQYKHRYVYQVMGPCVSTAKGGAEILKFNMALILFPVCRNFITFLRSRTKLGAIVPFNDNINFHKVIALGVAVGLGLHAGAHLTCDFPRLLHASDDMYAPLAKYFAPEKPPNYWWFVKGVEGWTGVVMVVLMVIAYVLAQPWFRRNRVNLPTFLKRLTGFNAFWYSHHLFVIVYILLIVHGEKLYLQPIWYKRTTWMYLAVPMGIYAVERLIRSFRSTYKISVQVLKVAVYPGNVLALYMTKPHGFKYTSGQYIYVNCSDISPFQWHPFSLTSAPGDDYISLHIRTLGDWTSQLKSTFSKVCQLPRTDQSGLLRADLAPGNYRPRMPKLLIDGPYGAPAQDYKNYDVLLLVGLGIGATPLISIVKDVVNNLKQQKDADLESTPEWLGSSNDNGSTNSSKKSSRNNSTASSRFAVKRAYFYWVTREEGSFEWFRGVMNEAAEYDQDHVIELHNYCTSVYEEGDARSALIAMLQSLHHAKSGVDIVSGTRVKTHFARPNWRTVFKHVAVNHGDQRVGVFYCGAPGLTSELRHLAQDFSRKTTTKFDFHKENF